MENLGKFLFNTHINTPSILFGLFTLCVSLLFIKKLSRKEVIILIIPTVYYFFDIIASCITRYAQSDENIWFYNWVLLLELLLYFFVFKSLFQSRKIKRIINIVIVVFTITHVTNIFFGQGSHIFCTFTLIPAHVAAVIFAYLHMKLTIDDINIVPIKQFSFWFSIASFISISTSIPVLSIINSLNENNQELADKIFILNDIAYCCWYALIIAGLIWTKKLTKI